MSIAEESQMVLSQLVLKYIQNAFRSWKNRWVGDSTPKKTDLNEIWTPAVIQRVVTLAILMLLSLLGNTIVIVVLTCSRTRCAASRVNVFIIHLAIGDLAVCLITMTGEILFEVFGEWVLGGIACKVVIYSEIVSLSSTTFLLMVMSWDRYVAICRPLDFTISARRARSLIFGAWFLAFVMAIPHLFIFVQVLEGYHPDGAPVYACLSRGYSQEWQRKLMFTWLTFYILLLPSMVITYCYVSIVRVVFSQSKDQQLELSDGYAVLRRSMPNSKSLSRAKIKTVKMTFCIILTFVACWTPYFVVHNIRIWSDYRYKISQPVIVFAETMALVNSVLNPILYGCFNLRMKQGLKDVCCRGSSMERNVCINSAFHSRTMPPIRTSLHIIIDLRLAARPQLLCDTTVAATSSGCPCHISAAAKESFPLTLRSRVLSSGKSHHLETLTYHDLHCVTHSPDCV
ncbi:putative cardioacceleratory peptide receptor-like [Penaeus vannamei]|uniref:Putative cardioacceleratory peptide receptor-like n=1 Tax=Penaeus vannamei TaxID=6689 RepID=A0A423TDP1_PENVA|nr:putative cardioacceleratory peptide receptor-like [Penaeus vannamei]